MAWVLELREPERSALSKGGLRRARRARAGLASSCLVPAAEYAAYASAANASLSRMWGKPILFGQSFTFESLAFGAFKPSCQAYGRSALAKIATWIFGPSHGAWQLSWQG